jgi:hypothetical protein
MLPSTFKTEAIMHGQKDMNKCDIDLLTLLFSANIHPIQISQIMEQRKGSQVGTICPKPLYNMNQRTEDLPNSAF